MSTTTTDTAARIYCGTYAKYNSGSIAGKWLDLEDYADADAFLAACRELHKDEPDPELMFQDFEGFPRAYYCESPDSGKLAEIYAWLELDEDDRQLLQVYRDEIREDGDIDDARDALLGRGYNTESDWAADWLEQTGGLEGVPEHLQNYIDYEAYARDARIGGEVHFVRVNGEVWAFSNQ